MSFDVTRIRKDFPILLQEIKNKPLVYLDNGATTQKPLQVIESITNCYLNTNANIHRGIYDLSTRMTDAHDMARERTRKYLNANSTNEVIFTTGTTHAVNIVACSFGERYVHEGDEIIVGMFEHHANLIPWMMLCERKKAKLRVIQGTPEGELDITQFKTLLNEKTRLVAIGHVSNVLGTIHPIERIISEAHAVGVPVFIDAAQSIRHIPIDVQKLNCDFLAFSGHKIYAPTGIGILYGKEKFLEEMPPYMGGGDMVDLVDFENYTTNVLPLKFEAGTPNYVNAVGLGEALEYVTNIGLNAIANHEKSILCYATEQMSSIEELKIYGTSKHKSALISFSLRGQLPSDVSTMLNEFGIATRSGRLCSQTTMDFFKISATTRASFAFYNTMEEVDILVDAIKKICRTVPTRSIELV